jgi:hypothetical protein
MIDIQVGLTLSYLIPLFSAGDPDGLSHFDLFDGIRELNIQYHFGKITASTDIMFQKFQEAYKDAIPEFDIKKVESICDSVVTAVRESVWTMSKRATTGTDDKKEKKKEREFIIDTNEPDWESLSLMKGTFITYNFPRSIDDIVEDVPLKRNKPENAEVQIAPNPFARGWLI